MPDAAVAETEVQPQLPIGAVKDKPGVTLVTMDNFQAFADQELGVTRTEGGDTDNDPEAEAASEAAELEAQKKAAEEAEQAAETAPKEGDTQGSDVFFNGKWVNKHNFKYRVHLEAEAARKEAREQVAKAEAEAKVSRETAEKAARETADLKAKYEPPKPATLGPKPLPQQFASVADYGVALEAWTADKTRQDDAHAQAEENAKAETERTVKQWNERMEAFKADKPDFGAKLAASQVKASEELRQAIIESDAGPQIFYHLIENPDAAEAIGKMTIAQMLKEVGRLEVKLGDAAAGSAAAGEKPQTRAAPVAKIAPKAEISKAPAPISPLKGANALPTVTSEQIAAIKDPTERHARFVAARKSGKLGK